MRRERRRRSHLIEALRLALNRQEIDVALQPQSDARSGRHSGFEALVRWRLGTSQVQPIELISIAEEAGLVSEVAAHQAMERSMGLSAETLHADKAGRIEKVGKAATGVGGIAALAAELTGRRFGTLGRVLSTLGGIGLMVGSACTRFGIFEAGQASARDPKYTVVPQRERLDARGS